MSPVPPVQPWTRRTWVLWVFLITAAQLLLIFWLSNDRDLTPPPPPPVTTLLLATPISTGASSVTLEQMLDPTLFALVTPQGFSRTAWLTMPQFPYGITNQSGPPRLLSLASEELVDDFAEFVQTNTVPGEMPADTLPIVLTPPVLPVPLVVNSTLVRVEDGLTNRPWTASQPLPRQPEPILTNSLVRVLVDRGGITFSAALLSSSGSAKADQDALDFAKAMRFSRSVPSVALSRNNEPAVEFGILSFQWYRIRWSEPETTTAKR